VLSRPGGRAAPAAQPRLTAADRGSWPSPAVGAVLVAFHNTVRVGRRIASLGAVHVGVPLLVTVAPWFCVTHRQPRLVLHTC